MNIAEPTKRFTDRVANYVRYRPTYPNEVITTLQKECSLTESSKIADIGSGTGIFTKLLLDHGHQVYAIEPNQAMLEAAKQWLFNYPDFIPVDATAEATTLAPNSIDLAVCAQSFHWFNDQRTHVEFNRILKDTGYAALIWNNRLPDVDDFSRAYEGLLKQDSIDYNKVNHRNISAINFKAFFRDGEYKQLNFANEQVFDEDGLIGRAFSSSYVPPQHSVEGGKFLEMLKEIFAKYNVNGKVGFQYQTEVYLGKV